MFTNRVTALIGSVSGIIEGFIDPDVEIDVSYQSRLYERDNVEAYYESNLMDLPLGAGMGAEIPMVFDTSVQTPSGRMHHAHISWIVYLLRNGLLGVLLLASYFLVTGSVIARKVFLNGGGTGLLLAGFMQLLSDLVTSFKANVMLESFSILPAVAIAWAMTANVKRSTGK
ncbi:MAG TPA: hypothetical protein DCZ13_09640 [Porticoccaceae bacterium]|nr:hypothetical protein [Porticoccaceae bacterium]